MNDTNGRYRIEYESFAKFLKGERIPFGNLVVLAAKSLLSFAETFVRHIPGGFGFKLRAVYYKPFLKHLGKNVLIDTGVHLNGLGNISIDSYTWIDKYCIVNAMLGEVQIGKRVHLAPFCVIASRAPVVIEDFVGVGGGTHIYSNSELPADGKRMSGPMVPEEHKAFISEPVTLRRECFVGANCVILPGTEIGEGGVVGANTTVWKNVKPYTIVSGEKLRAIGVREKVTVPEPPG